MCGHRSRCKIRRWGLRIGKVKSITPMPLPSEATTSPTTTTKSSTSRVKRRKQFEKTNSEMCHHSSIGVKTAEKKLFILEEKWARDRDHYWEEKSRKEYFEYPNAKNHKKWHRNHREEVYQLRNDSELPNTLYV
ncbi:hypothetical protein C9374_008268 [Naegleria lovaniensis]|uniref:Uncharacterized protein n=1 Tax=Naegleria lovaniensis TaxID=51637 RepID=A0AA88KL92_NAELO|nr:uncharacterized protein C9374_008268 [Naegleria lovaniensis]KAG2378629.1 hypothetical protein C9374_008268 [Naegleria lovaniensis]